MMATTTSGAFTVADSGDLKQAAVLQDAGLSCKMCITEVVTGNNPLRQRAFGTKRAAPPHRRSLQVVAKALYKSPSLARAAAAATSGASKDTYKGVNHVSLLVDNLERSLEFYQGVLGLALHPGRPDAKLPYRGAWLSTGSETIHLIELEDPDRARAVGGSGRGAVRPTCIGVHDVSAIMQRLQERGIEYTSLRPEREAIMFQDPDMKCLELATIDM